jgi:hypothetical protein
MLLVLLAVLAAGDDNRYAGGVPPTPLSANTVTEAPPAASACTIDTLKTSHTCVFDGRPAVSSDPKAQAAANQAFVSQLGVSLCKQRLETSTLDQPEKDARIKACTDRVRKISPQCALDGKTGIVDAEGRFAPLAKGCYLSIAEAVQRLDLPLMASEKKKNAAQP